jgi:hypothetical protein
MNEFFPMLVAGAIGAIVGLFLNKVRGGTWGFSKSIHGSGAYLAALGFASILYAVSQDAILAVAFAIAYIAGESIGWTKWIWCIPGRMSQEEYNKTWAVDAPVKHDKEWGESFLGAFVNEHKNYWLDSFLGMTFRGILWWTPVAAVFVWWFSTLGGQTFNAEVFGMISLFFGGGVLVLSVLFPLSYWFAAKLKGEGDYIGEAEGFYGAIYGAILSFAYLMVMIIVALSRMLGATF